MSDDAIAEVRVIVRRSGQHTVHTTTSAPFPEAIEALRTASEAINAEIDAAVRCPYHQPESK